MRKSLIVLLTVVLFASCTPPDVPTTGGETPDLPTYVIGDFYQKGNVEGVVFQTNAGGAHGKLVSLDESRAVWCDNLHAHVATEATHRNNGWSNANIIRDNFDLLGFPAVGWGVAKNNLPVSEQLTSFHWYVPASNELRSLLLHYNKLNATLKAHNLPTLEGKSYWSSTEFEVNKDMAVSLCYDEGDCTVRATDSIKTRAHYVRAVRDF